MPSRKGSVQRYRPAMPYQWESEQTKEWLFHELDHACDSIVDNRDDEFLYPFHRGRMDALVRVIWHVFDDAEIDMLRRYVAQRIGDADVSLSDVGDTEDG